MEEINYPRLLVNARPGCGRSDVQIPGPNLEVERDHLVEFATHWCNPRSDATRIVTAVASCTIGTTQAASTTPDRHTGASCTTCSTPRLHCCQHCSADSTMQSSARATRASAWPGIKLRKTPSKRRNRPAPSGPGPTTPRTANQPAHAFPSCVSSHTHSNKHTNGHTPKHT